MMYVSQMQGCLVFEPANDAELQDWQPWPGAPVQFVKSSNREFWIFYQGKFIGSATRIVGSLDWQASSNTEESSVCIAPLPTPLDCALRLVEATREH
jgi:hypothetical protein